MAGLHKVLVIGVGSIGERHLRCFQNTGRVETALVEVNARLRATVAEKYGVAQAFADLDAALATSFDAAIIATPAPLHVLQARRLAQSGIHLLIEKPLGIDLEGIDELRQMVAERQLTAGVAYVYRSHPTLTAMRQDISSGRFGRPVQVFVVSGQHFPTYRPAYRDIYYANRASGGGAIQDALTHLVNAGEWLVGPVERLVADCAHQVLEGVEVEDTVHLLTRQGGVLGSYILNQYQAPNETAFTVVCEKGTVRFALHRDGWQWMTEPGDVWNEMPAETLARDALFVAQANNFLDAVEGKRPFPCSLDEGLQTLRVNLAALSSVEQGGWVTIQP